MERMPRRSCFKFYMISSSNGQPQILSPPFPVFVGSPPWMMKPRIFRWNFVPSYKPIAAKARKFLQVFGHSSQNSQILIGPWLVTKVTDILSWDARRVYYNYNLLNNDIIITEHMGTQTSTIPTAQIPISQLKPLTTTQQSPFSPPFHKYTSQTMDIKHHRIKITLQIEQPEPESIQINQQIYTDLQDAFDYKTKQIVLDSILTDEQYMDRNMYIGQDGTKMVMLELRKFSRFRSYAFNNILYQMHMNQIIGRLGSTNCNTIQDKYIIQTGLEAEGEQHPNTQVYVLEPASTNLSQIIKYRRQNKWGWKTTQFNTLVYDLVQAVKVLHNANISHNDIRPYNVLYNLQRDCYQLAGFGNAVKCGKGRMNKSMSVSQVRGSMYYGAPELKKSLEANLEQADIYSLGVTLLCAFYLCEPINLTSLAKYNKKYEKQYPILLLLQQMIQPLQKRSDINTLHKKIASSPQKSSAMKHLIQSLKYKHAPKGDALIKTKKIMSEGYQRLGLWNQWKSHQNQAYQLQENTLDDFKKANSLYQLAKIQSCRGDSLAASQYAKSASSIYRDLGYTAYDQGNINQSLNIFTKAIECSKYFENGHDMDTAKNLQGLALIHAEKSQYEISKPLINQSTYIVIKNTGKQSIEYCRIKMCEAKIETDFGQFEQADRILHECSALCDLKIYENQSTVMKLKAQILHEIGRNAMLQSSYCVDNQQVMISKAYRYLGQSFSMNQKLPDNTLDLAGNHQTLGQIQLRKHNYVGAKLNFKKAEQLRLIHSKIHSRSTTTLQKQHAETLCNIAACESGVQNYEQALKKYNQALQIYRRLYGSDHNKMSAMAIGNMSKIYYKIGDTNRAKQCLQIATQILGDLLGTQDPDYQHFKYLQQTI